MFRLTSTMSRGGSGQAQHASNRRRHAAFIGRCLSCGRFEHILPISILRQAWCLTGMRDELPDCATVRLEGVLSPHRRDQPLDAHDVHQAREASSVATFGRRFMGKGVALMGAASCRTEARSSRSFSMRSRSLVLAALRMRPRRDAQKWIGERHGVGGSSHTRLD
jgi:hypothetical protein